MVLDKYGSANINVHLNRRRRNTFEASGCI
jgi:hypothetical protein